MGDRKAVDSGETISSGWDDWRVLPSACHTGDRPAGRTPDDGRRARIGAIGECDPVC